MKIIDTHSHIFPEKIESVAVKAIGDFYEMDAMDHNGLSETLLSSGKKAGIDKFLVFSTATTARQVQSINNFIISQCREHDEFIGAGTMYIDFPEPEEELMRIRAEGIHGIKLHPDFQKFAIDDKELYPVYDVLEELGMYIITHAGDKRYSFSNPPRVAKVARDFPHLRIIAAHFGGWSEWDEARDHLCLSNVYFDTSSTLGFTGPEAAQKALKTFDPKHIFFGTDFPMWDPAEEIERIMSLGIKQDLLEDIMWNNFKEFYYYEEI